MIQYLAKKWSNYLIEHGADPENEDVLVYGIEVAINEIIADIIAFAIAFIIGKPLEMLIWQLAYLPLRVCLGGHHANSHIVCLIYSTVLSVACVLLLPLIVGIWWLPILDIILTLIIACFVAPFIHPNRQVSDSYRVVLKKRGKIVAVVASIVVTITYFVCPEWVAQIAGLGMLAATIQCIIGKTDHYIKNK